MTNTLHRDFYDNFEEWRKAVRQDGGDVFDKSHDSTWPDRREWIAVGWEKFMGAYSTVQNVGFIEVKA
jgi:hypothetical protein